MQSSESGALEPRESVAVPPEPEAKPFAGMDDYAWMMPEILRIESKQAELLGELLIRHFHPKSVIDIGCGPGIYLLSFQRAGAEVFGVDGCVTGGECIPGCFERVDLRFPWKPPKRYELGLCIEVAEHLKPEFADTLVQTCVDACQVLLFTGARPGQVGSYHYNEQPKSYWLEKFAKHGWGLHRKNDEIVQEIEQVEEFRRVSWLPPNVMVLTRRNDARDKSRAAAA